MATTESRTNAPAGRKYVDFDEFIEYQVRKTRSGIRATDLLTAVVVLGLAITSYLLVFVVVDQWVTAAGVGYWPRVIALTLLISFVVGWSVWKIALPYLRRVSALFAAREIEHAQPDLKSSLLTLIDLKQAGRAVPAHIVSAMEKRAATKLSGTDIEHAVDRRMLMRLSYALLAVVAVMCLYTVLSPKPISASVLRALLPSSTLSVSTRTRIDAVDPGDAEVLARSQLEVTVDLSGEIPESATLLFTTADRSFVDEPIVLRDTGDGLHRFRGVLAGPNGRGLLENLTYHVTAGDAESREYRVTVKQAPYATVTEVFLDYPDYMRLDDKAEPGGDIDAWEGTTVTVRAETNMPVATGTIERSTADDASIGSDSLPMTLIDDTHLEATWKLEFDDGVPYRFYRVEVKTEGGATDPRPKFYRVNIRRDIPPEVRILHPTGDVELPANGTLPVAFETRDPDFMLRYVRMEFAQVDEDPAKFAHKTRHLFESPPGRSSFDGIEDVRLSEFNLAPGDVLSLWLEAKDNQAPLGTEDGNVTRTSRINVTILDPVSRDEAQQQLDEQRQELQQKLDEAQQEQREAGGEQSAEGAGEQGQTEEAPDESTQQSEGTSSESGEQSTTGNETQGEAGSTPQRSDSTSGNEQPSEQGQPQQGEQGAEDAHNDTEGMKEGNQDSAREDGTKGKQTEQGGQDSQTQDEAEDSEALRRLFDEYQKEIEQAKQEREKQQQQQQNDNSNRQPEQQQQPDQTGQGPESSNNDGEGGETPSGPETPDAQTSPDGSNQPSAETGNTGQTPNEPKQTSEGAANGEQTPSDDTNTSAEARPGDVDNPRQETPADEEGPAQEQRATGNEEGTARPETDPNAETTQAQQPLEREGGTDPATRPRENPSDKTGEGMPQDTGGGNDPEGAQPAPDSDRKPSDSPGDRGSSQSDMTEAQRPPARTDQQPSGPDQSNPAPGNPNGQRSEQPSAGEQGSSQQASEGTKGGSQQGPGDSTTAPGSQSDAQGQSGGQPGDQPGQGSSSSPQGNQPGGQGTSDQAGQNGNQGSESGSQGGESEGGSQGGQSQGEQSGSQGGQGGEGGGQGGDNGEGGGEGGQGGQSGSDQSAGGGGQGGGDTQSEGGAKSTAGSGAGSSARAGGGGAGGGSQASHAPGADGSGGPGPSGAGPDAPNLDDKRRASELVLNRLKDQIERGEAPQDLLDDLGWTKEKLQGFMDRLEQRLADTGEDTSPEAQARRRQFETILEGIDYASEGQERNAEAGPREAAQGFGSQRRPIPPEYQKLQEQYRGRLSRQTRTAE